MNGVNEMAGAEREQLSPRHRAMTRRTSLSFPAPLAMGDWLAIGRELFVINDASAWWLGDWLVYGQSRYPDRYRRAVEGTSLHYKTLRNYAWVARKFDPSRRHDALSFQHHAEVAGLPPEEQDVWLDRAEQDGWSVSMLRKRLRGHRDPDALTRASETLGFDLYPERRRRWQEAAERAGTTLDDWISTVLDQETGSAPRSERTPAVQRVPIEAPREA
jgi:hypothetical protein